MKYAHIIAACASELWAMQAEKLQAVVEVLAFQATGGKLTAEELEAKIGKGVERAVARQEGAVALLPLRGIIANRAGMVGDISAPGTSSEAFGKMFKTALRDDGVKAIVIDVDTPGGAVSGASELSQLIYESRGIKPIVAHVNSNMGSAGYWIGSAADEIAVMRSGAVGAIGVYAIHEDITKLLDQKGVTRTLIKAGKFKGEGIGPLTEEAIAAAQARVDAAYAMFLKDVARNRGVSVAKVREGFGQGRMVDAEPAVAEGMADRIATLDETMQRFGVSIYPPPAGSPKKGARAFAPARELRALDLAENHGG